MPERDASPRTQLRKLTEAVYPTLGMLASRDQRVGAKLLYKNEVFGDATRKYLIALLDTINEVEPVSFLPLQQAAIDFVTFMGSLYPGHKRGFLTPLRKEYGRTLTELYKDSLALIELIELVGQLPNSELEPLVLPEPRPSPIYTKVENDRIVLDSGRALFPFLRKEAISQTREYLRKELSELEKTLQGCEYKQRPVDAFSRLQSLLHFEDDAGAIAFGLHVRLLSNLTNKIENELSDVLNIHIASTLTHAAYFASQYKDWVEFVQNAHTYPSRDAINDFIDSALTQVEETLSEESHEHVDERIPQSLRLIRSVLNGNADDRKQAIYAAVTGVENLCIAAITYSYQQAKTLVRDFG